MDILSNCLLVWLFHIVQDSDKLLYYITMNFIATRNSIFNLSIRKFETTYIYKFLIYTTPKIVFKMYVQKLF